MPQVTLTWTAPGNRSDADRDLAVHGIGAALDLVRRLRNEARDGVECAAWDECESTLAASVDHAEAARCAHDDFLNRFDEEAEAIAARNDAMRGETIFQTAVE